MDSIVAPYQNLNILLSPDAAWHFRLRPRMATF
jgi:hypothetical protein